MGRGSVDGPTLVLLENFKHIENLIEGWKFLWKLTKDFLNFSRIYVFYEVLCGLKGQGPAEKYSAVVREVDDCDSKIEKKSIHRALPKYFKFFPKIFNNFGGILLSFLINLMENFLDNLGFSFQTRQICSKHFSKIVKNSFSY